MTENGNVALKLRIRKQGLTYADVAKALGISTQAVSSKVSQYNLWNLHEVAKLTALLGLTGQEAWELLIIQRPMTAEEKRQLFPARSKGNEMDIESVVKIVKAALLPEGATA